jgi:FKBP-type peptidyl-prolyl cis-trans isomerase FkpA
MHALRAAVRAARPLRLAAVAASLSLLALAGCPAQQGGDAASAVPESEDDKAFYTLGYFVMKRANEFQLDDREREMVLAGARDALSGGEAVVDVETYQQRLAALFRERQSQGAEAEKLAAQDWIEEQAGKPGAVKTPSGLVYVETEAGEGDRPAATDTVRVHYHGTLRDGTVFDSSVDRGTPAVFPLNRVIPCWTEALQRMGEGGKAEIVCPSSIAYGDRGAPPRIEPGAALHFEVELLEIVE